MGILAEAYERVQNIKDIEEILLREEADAIPTEEVPEV